MISIAADTYDRVASENREIGSLQKKVMFLADYVFDTGLPGFGYKKRFIYNVSKVKKDERGKRKWEGKIAMFKDAIANAMNEQKEYIDKSISGVQNEVGGSIKLIGKLKGQMTDMQLSLKSMQEQISTFIQGDAKLQGSSSNLRTTVKNLRATENELGRTKKMKQSREK